MLNVRITPVMQLAANVFSMGKDPFHADANLDLQGAGANIVSIDFIAFYCIDVFSNLIL